MKYNFEETTALKEVQDIENQLKVYPNPVNDVSFIEVTQKLKLKNTEINIFSIDGKLIKSLIPQEHTNKHLKISTKSIAKGTYILQLKSENYEGRKKIIVE